MTDFPFTLLALTAASCVSWFRDTRESDGWLVLLLLVILWLLALPLHTFHIETFSIKVDDDMSVEVYGVGGILLLADYIVVP